ncbi:hypothetical protein A3K34_00920 [candidate division WWE3 bacterium RIFOXYC1_FULL_40_10]|uniref:PDZ domain-containing protein n=1 Tax=candidate division WWE3 bacterium RIFOXYA2_FULL_46_9 TaxID=1802636 RepID=A0A1F4W211_UNCKA|nr:MAG: hypothetical protein A3K58_00920 [candidate division WWE3 bacterium RIFOXYB1_FULL_40_22]OGC62187.1 MAG: hypothetical protein A3K37_00920 [candidate division WWE3 bacterium RIFOXYA1_FULL_40_11]OGC63454.1 MAG: hypothetical protein A2264_01395 [candidate division WWE3 bacterium RIFOXYA2_FULL_46_9]OGC64461.1 MAG: hypothetical protein A2326_00195 [candidate division WWE3 bacterium RIFOXYB2_FULL_41_6]OGC66570.1 MAG: hypothetical protein A3K34_00920 [candidate division WWE3 bacterium RIFOXYC1_
MIDVVERVSPSVVSVLLKQTSYDFFEGTTQQESGIGTGFIVDANGLIVTNSHVVSDPTGQYSVVLKDGTIFEVKKVNMDEVSDLAILEITARNLPVVELGDSDSLKVGQGTIAIGNALGKYQNTVTTGVVSGIARQLSASGGFGTQEKVYENAIQTDAALNPGNSGGPLLNSSGQVIGINVATTLGADNISFAIPVNDLKPLLESFIEQGRIVRPYLGIQYQMVTKDIASSQNLPEGAYITRVFVGSPADKSGLKRGDIIIRLNDTAITSSVSVAKLLAKLLIGDTVTLTVDREGKISELKLILEEMPETYTSQN